MAIDHSISLTLWNEENVPSVLKSESLPTKFSRDALHLGEKAH
jgi:hypothetical protein